MSSPAVQESPAAEAARKRREKLLARAEDRMKLVSGEKKVAIASSPVSDAPQIEAATTTTTETASSEVPVTPVKEDNRPRWEKKWESNVSAVAEKREIPQAFLNRLEVTEKMAVEAPRAQVDPSSGPKNVPVMKSSSMPFSKVRLDSLLTSITAAYLGYMSGSTNGEFISQNIWLPMGSFLLFALLFRVIISTSLTKSKLMKPQNNASSQGWLFTMLKFFPAVAAIANKLSAASGYMKDSYDDMMLFVFAHGLASSMVVSRMVAAKVAGGGMQGEEVEQEFVSLM
jgi:hypothetical protein